MGSVENNAIQARSTIESDSNIAMQVKGCGREGYQYTCINATSSLQQSFMCMAYSLFLFRYSFADIISVVWLQCIHACYWQS